MDKKEKIGYQLLCLALLVAVFVLIWQNKKGNGDSVANIKKSEVVRELTFELSGHSEGDFKLPQANQTGGIPLMKALKERKTTRKFTDKELSDQQISDLLWAANGVNRQETGKRTAPSARNCQEIDIYLFTRNAIYFYDAADNLLTLKKEGDFRVQAGKNDFFADAPIALVYVADFDKMKDYNEEGKNFYSATDVGFVSQNVYLYCASENLSTVVCGHIDREGIKELLEVENGKVLLSQPIGFTN